MSIKKRIIFAAALLISLFLAREIVNWIGNNAVMHKNNTAYMFKGGTMHLQGIFRGINEFIIDEEIPLVLTGNRRKDMEENTRLFHAVIEKYIKKL